MALHLLARVVQATDRLLHPTLRARGWETVRKARLLLGSALLIVPFVLHDSLEGLRTGSAVRVAAGLNFSVAVTVAILAIHRWGALELATHVLAGSIALSVCSIALFVGVPMPLIGGLGSVALLALFVAGRGGVVWVPITIALALGVAAIRALGVVPLRAFVYTPVAQAIDAALMCALVSGLAWMFVSSRQHALEELAEANTKLTLKVSEHSRLQELASAANLAKSEFLANMSHEIRTPMTAIMGFGDLLLDEDSSTSARTEHVEIIRRNGKHLLGLIDDILDLSKIEAGKIALERMACSPHRVIADVASLLRVPALAKGLSLRVVYDTAIPVSIQSDPTRLRQILMNLVSNAVKFTSAGGIVVAVRCDDPSAPSPTLCFDVRDTGPGIAPDQLERVFAPFAQADASTTRKFGGTGLGLSISLRLAEALGGSLSLSSALGVGSTFTLRVATESLAGVEMSRDVEEAGPSAASPPIRAGALLRGCVLLAEDGADNQALISAHLKRAGAVVTVAENGRAAVRMALEARASGVAFDLVLMDLQMPELDGYGATRELRDAGYDLPIVALTAHAMAGEREKCVSAGCDDYLTKPIVRSELSRALARYLHAVAA